MDIMANLGLISGLGGVALGFFIFYLVTWCLSKEAREIIQQRKYWYKQYPVGSYIEVVSWNVITDYSKLKSCYLTQAEANEAKERASQTERKVDIYKVITPEEYFTCIRYPEKDLWEDYLLNHEIFLCVKNADGKAKTITADTVEECRKGIKQIYKVSDVKMKILELKERKSGNENIKSYSNSRKKNYGENIKSR